MSVQRLPDYADRVLQEAMTAATGGLDPAAGEQALTNAVKAVAKQMAALEAKDYQAMPAAEIARAVSHTAKAGDVLFRLMEFAKGYPDSRPDTATDWLRGLTNEQLRTVERWVTEREQKENG